METSRATVMSSAPAGATPNAQLSSGSTLSRASRSRTLAKWIAGVGRRWGLLALVVAIAAFPFAPSLLLDDLSPRWGMSLQVGFRLVGIAIALAIFLLTWNTRRGQSNNFVFAGLGFLVTAVLGVVELVLVPGISGLADDRDGHVAALLRTNADFAAAVALLAAAFGSLRASSIHATRFAIALTVAECWLGIQLAISVPSWLDQASAVEADTAAALALVAALLFARRHRPGRTAFGLLALASLLAGMGMVLTSLQHSGGRSQAVIGAVYQAFAWLIVYRVIFRIGVQGPRRRLVESGLVVEEDRHRYRQLFNSAPDGLLLVDKGGKIIEANPAAALMFGWSASAIVGLPVEVLVPQPFRAQHESARARFLAAPRAREMSGSGSLLALRQDGDTFPVEVALVPQQFGGRSTTLCIVRDVTQRRQLEQSLLRQTLHDGLTDLPNRRHFRESVTKALAHAERHGSTLAVLFVDLDNFKQVNDSLGHSHGDELLRQVAQRLHQTLRAGDLLARLGGDEFALLLNGVAADDAATVAAKILRALEPPFHHAGQTMKVGASIGITLSPTDGRSVEDLLSNADLAMYRAKGHGRNTWRFFEKRMTERLRARSALQQDLARAIERDQLSLVFQPRVRASDGALTGFESLLRWRHPEHGNVSPAIFIELAEESGQIVMIGEWVLRQSCAQAAFWRAGGADDLTMAVNVSTHQLRHPSFVDQVHQALNDTGWPAEQLELEITETALMEDPQEATLLLRQLVGLGVRLAVDDFGTGYSSLAYLKDYPLHRLKVDRSFVQGLQGNSRDRVIASSIIQLAHALGLQVTAEGVETVQQREFLVQQHCDELQGYLFGMPLPAAACEDWLGKAMRSAAATR